MKTPLQILLVEDNEGDVEMTRRAFRDEPACNLSVVNDGVEALEFLSRQGAYADAPSPHIILLDLNMPRMDGRELLEAVKADSKWKSIPVVMLTSSNSPADIRDCYERQASSYVVKPFDGREFGRAIRQAVYFWATDQHADHSV